MLSNPSSQYHVNFKQANIMREKNRKVKIIGDFDWKESTFYGYANKRKWIGKRGNNLMKNSNLKMLTHYLEDATGLKRVRTNKRYKEGLLKYIDDYFHIFKVYLDSWSFDEEKQEKEQDQNIENKILQWIDDFKNINEFKNYFEQ
jgi:hypothetical protein